MENEEKNQAEQENKSQSVWKEIWDYAKIIIAVFVIAYLLGHFVREYRQVLWKRRS